MFNVFFTFLGNANNFETMEECILNCSGPDPSVFAIAIDEGVFQKPTQFESFTARLQRFKSKFNERNKGGFSPFQGT